MGGRASVSRSTGAALGLVKFEPDQQQRYVRVESEEKRSREERRPARSWSGHSDADKTLLWVMRDASDKSRARRMSRSLAQILFANVQGRIDYDTDDMYDSRHALSSS